ncbi:MAG: tRNA pseudouridine synthase A, partial [Lachnospiraceae bacterium]|nr:tRNA pseudouridine synthase A [Lachnospiraceae bacterium]
HAEGAVCVFDTESRIPGEKFSYAINQTLSPDIRVRASKEVELDFHPRKVNSRKTYRYRIRHDEFINPIDTRYTHHVYTKLNVTAMQKACEYIIGKHDFKAFCSAHTDVDTTVRTVYDVHIDVTPDKKLMQMSGMMKSSGTKRAEGDEDMILDPRKSSSVIDIYVTGNGFLYNMVRIIAGTLIDVGQGKINPEDIPGILESCDRENAGPTAPAKGLTLMGYRMTQK